MQSNVLAVYPISNTSSLNIIDISDDVVYAGLNARTIEDCSAFELFYTDDDAVFYYRDVEFSLSDFMRIDLF